MSRTTHLKFTYFAPENRFKKCLFPRLLLQGHWLARLGWDIGMTVEVVADETQIVIRRTSGQALSPATQPTE